MIAPVQSSAQGGATCLAVGGSALTSAAGAQKRLACGAASRGLCERCKTEHHSWRGHHKQVHILSDLPIGSPSTAVPCLLMHASDMSFADPAPIWVRAQMPSWLPVWHSHGFLARGLCVRLYVIFMPLLGEIYVIPLLLACAVNLAALRCLCNTQ